MRERTRSAAKSKNKLERTYVHVRTRTYARNAEEPRFGALLLKNLDGNEPAVCRCYGRAGRWGAKAEGDWKPKPVGTEGRSGEMSARSQIGAMHGSTHNQHVRSLFLTATISAGPLAASPGPGHNYHPTGGLRAAGAGSRRWFA